MALSEMPDGFGEWPWRKPQSAGEYDSGPINRLFTVWSHSGQAFRKFEAEALAVQNNAELSDQGKAVAIRRLLRSLKESLLVGEHGNRIRAAYKELRSLQAKLDSPSDKGSDPVLTFLERQELRAWFLRLDADARRAAVRDAVGASDQSLLTAIATAPKAMRLIADPQVRQAVEETLHRTRDPESYNAAQALKAAVLTAQQSVATSIERAHRAVGVPFGKREVSTAANVLSDPQIASANFEDAVAAVAVEG